jgi:hypothetical protein
MAREALGGVFPRIQEQADPEMAIFMATRRAALNRYIKAVTGAQFSIAELDRYEAQLPGSGADEAVADTKIRLLAQQALAEFKVLVAQNGGLEAIARDPDLQKKIGILGLDIERARAAIGAEPPESAEEAAASALPPGIPEGSTRAGRSKRTGKTVWRSPDGKLWSE